MRKLWIYFMLAVLIAICITDSILVGGTIDKIHAEATELSAELETSNVNGEAANLIKKMYDEWNQKERVLAVFVYHSEIKVIGEKIVFIKALIEEKVEEEAKVETKNLVFLLESFKIQASFNFANIF